MKVSNYIQTLRTENFDYDSELKLNLRLATSVLSLEQTLVEESPNLEKVINNITELLTSAFSLGILNLIDFEVHEDTPDDANLDFWKDNVTMLNKTHHTSMEVYLYNLRSSLLALLNEKSDKLYKVYIYEIIIKTFLFIDDLGLSINTILTSQKP